MYRHSSHRRFVPLCLDALKCLISCCCFLRLWLNTVLFFNIYAFFSQDLREECLKLRTRVFDLEQQNRALSVLFQQKIKPASDLLLQVNRSLLCFFSPLFSQNKHVGVFFFRTRSKAERQRQGFLNLTAEVFQFWKKTQSLLNFWTAKLYFLYAMFCSSTWKISYKLYANLEELNIFETKRKPLMDEAAFGSSRSFSIGSKAQKCLKLNI